MQTNFTAEQLEDPRLEEVDGILRRCVHCGFCTATCPTYVLLGDERDSPRGRIYLMKDMFESGAPASKEVTLHIDRCLSCLSCMTTCPSGVDYMHLVDLARAHIRETAPRPTSEWLFRRLLGGILPSAGGFRAALALAVLARPFRGVLRAMRLKRLTGLLDLAPATGPRRGQFRKPGVIPAEGVRKKRVALLTGCAQQPLRPEINDATIRLLTRHGVEVVIPEDQGCCGALVHHMGWEERAQEQARRNVDAWTAAGLHERLDAILINASGCGTTVKDYGHLLARDQGYADRAAHVAGLARDVTEFLAEIGLRAPERWFDLTLAYHSACSMQHGQRIIAEPRDLLRQAGFTLVEIPEGHLCCGSAGTYNITQPEIARALRDRKLYNIESVRPDAVAAGNIGCITQLQQGSSIPIVHTVELLDWALGGPCPRELRQFENRARKVKDLVQADAA